MLIMKNQRMNKITAAIDYGTKYCGIAYSPNGVNVLPVEVVEHDNLETVLGDLINEKGINQLVFGLPLSTNGHENELCEKVRQCARRLKRQFDLPIDYIDERFSSKSVVTNDKKQRIDDMAAAQILEYYFCQ